MKCPARRVSSGCVRGLALIKPSVRGQAAYTLSAPVARRKLNQNESPYDFPLALKAEVLDEVAGAPWQRYPEFAPPALLERLAGHYGWRADGILIGNGSNELIQATLSVSLGAGDVVVAPSPTFSLYRLLTNVLGGRYRPVPMGREFEFDLDGVIESAVREQARVVVLNSPNNPTGSALPAGAVERCWRRRARRRCATKRTRSWLPDGHPAAGRTSPGRAPHLLQGTGHGGAPIWACVGAPAARELAKGKLPYNVNLVTLAAASEALENSTFFRRAHASWPRLARAFPAGSARWPGSRSIRARPTSS